MTPDPEKWTPEGVQGYVAFLRPRTTGLKKPRPKMYAAFEGGMTPDYLKAQVFQDPEDALETIRRRNPNNSLWDVPGYSKIMGDATEVEA